jgi:quercetin 2,3-dioxygenase
MIDIRKFNTLGAANHGWLDARHHFSFANYYDPARMGWGNIRVWNDDVIAPGSGFAPHSHRDMEIITYVRSGVTHSEYNLESEETTLFQIWVHPRAPGGAPHWGMQTFPKEDRAGDWVVLASGYGDEGALTINADARVYGATLTAGGALSYKVVQGHSAYFVVSKGMIEINGHSLNLRDGAALGEGDYAISSSEGAQIVMVETNGV